MEEKTCVECGMPINEETKCKCSEEGTEKCIHCCECEEGCECNCKEKSQAILDKEEGGDDEEEPVKEEEKEEETVA